MPWEALFIGAGLGLSLAAPPGPVLAKVAFDTARGRWGQGIAVGLGATTADATFFALVMAGLAALVPGPRTMAALALVGVALMDYFAYAAWRSARRPLETAPSTRWGGFAAGYFLAATSPFNFAWWITTGAPFVHLYGPLLALGFFAAIVAWVLFSVALFAFARTRVARFETYVAHASALMLAGFGLLLAYRAFGVLWG